MSVVLVPLLAEVPLRLRNLDNRRYSELRCGERPFSSPTVRTALQCIPTTGNVGLVHAYPSRLLEMLVFSGCVVLASAVFIFRPNLFVPSSGPGSGV